MIHDINSQSDHENTSKMIYDITGCSVIGFGGTKTIYKIDDETCVAVPNAVDGKGLINIWPRIIREELEISDTIISLGVPALKFKPCIVKYLDEMLPTISSKPFASYIKDGIYIIDTKNTESAQWPKDGSLQLIKGDKYDLNNWIKIIEPLVKDLITLFKNNIFLPSDARNLAFVAKGCSLHSGSDLPFEVRLWCFDFASKHKTSDIIGDKVNFSAKYRTLRSLMENVIWEELAPNSMILSPEQDKIWKDLVEHFKPQLRFEDDNDDEYNNPDMMGCIIC